MAVALVSGCYAPSARDCSYRCNDGNCPTGLFCVDKFCRDDLDPGNRCSPGIGGDGGGGNYAAMILADQPIAYWRVNDVAGATTARNEIASPINEATYQGTVGLGEPGAIIDDPDLSVRLDGDGGSDCLMVPTSQSINFGSSSTFTLETWLKLKSSTGSDDRFLFGKINPSPQLGYALRIALNGMLELESCDASTTPCEVKRSGASITALQWVHIAATYDGPAGKLAKVYLNGSLAIDVPFANDLGTSTANLYIGCVYNGNQPDGWIDEVAIYNRVLDPITIARHHDVGAGN